MNKPKRKSYFQNTIRGNKKEGKKPILQSGMKGFLCTCNFHEKECISEALNIINEYVEKKSITTDIDTIVTHVVESKDEVIIENIIDCIADGSGSHNTENGHKKTLHIDINDELNNEVDNLKTETASCPNSRFQVVSTGIKNIVFIQSKLIDPLEVVSPLLRGLHKMKVQKSRYLLRLIPVQITCKPYINEILSKIESLLSKYFSSEPKTFCIVFKRHSNSNLNRDQVITNVAKIILKKNSQNKVDLKNAEIVVIIEVIRAVCLISIAPDYFTYKKYNLVGMCSI